MDFVDKVHWKFMHEKKNSSKGNFNEELVQDFALSILENIIKKKIYIGWQDVPREYERLQSDIVLLAVNPRFEELGIDENEDLLERIMCRFTKL